MFHCVNSLKTATFQQALIHTVFVHAMPCFQVDTNSVSATMIVIHVCVGDAEHEIIFEFYRTINYLSKNLYTKY